MVLLVVALGAVPIWQGGTSQTLRVGLVKGFAIAALESSVCVAVGSRRVSLYCALGLDLRDSRASCDVVARANCDGVG